VAEEDGQRDQTDDRVAEPHLLRDDDGDGALQRIADQVISAAFLLPLRSTLVAPGLPEP
jgi:hypothetical protein